MKVLFLTDGPQNPAGRFRCEQFFPAFERAGIDCTERYSYGHWYNRLLQTPASTAYRTLGRLRRAVGTIISPGYDLIFLQRTALPFSSAPEVFRARFGTPTIFDFDDAIYLGPDGNTSGLRSRAFRGALGSASWIIAGNEHLARVAGLPEKTTVIPTVVNSDALAPAATRRRGSPITIGWMGTASNFVHLRTVLPELLNLVHERPGLQLKIVSNRPLPELAGKTNASFVFWSESTEAALLSSFDIGLMPLTDSEVARGKCAFKILQYMAVGIPVVASAVGANLDVLRGEAAGRLIHPGSSWSPALSALIGNPELREAMGRAGRDLVERSYSVNSVASTYIDLFHQLVERSHKSNARTTNRP